MPRFGLVLLIFLFGTAAQAGTAHAGFAPDNELIGGGDQFQATDIAADAQGNSITVYYDQPGNEGPRLVKARRVSAGGEIGPVLELAPGESGFQAAVDMTAAGRAFAAWRAEEGVGGPDGVKGRWIEPDGTLGPVLTFVTGVGGVVDVEQVEVTVGAEGVATVGWRGFTGSQNFAIRRVSPGGALSETVVDISDGVALSPIRLEALPGGSTLATWRGLGLEKNVISPSLELAGDETVSIKGDSYLLATDSTGHSLAIWREDAGETFAIVGRFLDPGGAIVGSEFTIEEPAEGFLGISSLSADSDGDFIVTWYRQDEKNIATTYARTVNTAAAFGGPATPFSIYPEDAGSAAAALFDDGTGALTWGADDVAKGRAFQSPATPIGPIEVLNGEQEQLTAASAPAAGVAAFLLKYNNSGSTGETKVRRFLVPPSCAASTAATLAGTTTTLPLPCEGPAIEGVRIVSGPSHGTLGAYDPATSTLPYAAAPDFHGPDAVTYEALNDGGASGPATVSIAVADVTRPRITALRFVRPKGKAAKRRRPPYKFDLRFSESAKARVAVQRRLPGVRRGKRCLKPRNRAQLRRGKRCTRFVGIGAVTSKRYSQRIVIRASAKISRKLRKGGRFRIVAVATDKAGLKSSAKRRSIRTR